MIFDGLIILNASKHFIKVNLPYLRDWFRYIDSSLIKPICDHVRATIQGKDYFLLLLPSALVYIQNWISNIESKTMCDVNKQQQKLAQRANIVRGGAEANQSYRKVLLLLWIGCYSLKIKHHCLSALPHIFIFCVCQFFHSFTII